ncbi:MAG: hypothetical protein ABJ215_10530 [Alphaproteobacteria bacterium]
MQLRYILAALSALLIMAGGWAHAQTPRDVYTLDMAAVECFDVIGKAPEHREVMQRRNGADPGPAQAFLVKIRDTTVADIRATLRDIEPSPHPGFEHFRSSAIRLDIGDDDAGSMTQVLPRDRFVMFTMAESVVAEIERQRPRCGARLRFDRKPFEAMHRRVRDTLRQMLDQGPA